MNIGSIKSFLGGNDAVGFDTKNNQSAQQDKLVDAAKKNQASVVGTMSSQYTIAYRAIGESLQQNVSLNGETSRKSAEYNSASSKPMFDFEEVADNVMQFVGGVIRQQAKNGAETEALSNLFDQARTGVEKGIGQAKRYLAGFMNDELSDGINKVSTELSSRISALEEEIFAPQSAQQTSVELAAGTSKSSELLIRTRDGDEVTLSFSRQNSVYYAGSSYQTQNVAPTSGSSYQASASQSLFSYLSEMGVSLSISGDLDEEELTAISKLVENISKLANEFFYGDVQKAFTEALGLGYDKDELVGFSLQLTKTQSAAVTSEYAEVQQYSDSETLRKTPKNAPLMEYVDEVLKTMDQASTQLGSFQDYNGIVNELVNQMGDEVKVPDLVSAISRFHQFNNSIVESAEKTSNATGQNSADV